MMSVSSEPTRRLPLFACLLAACGGDPDGGSLEPSTDPWVYLQTTVATPEGRTAYLQLMSEVDGVPNPELALELAGNARVFSDGTRLFTGEAESPVIQAWTPATTGELIPGERLSLAQLGLSFVPYGNNFVTPDKAYLFDGSGARAIIWDPTALAVRGELDLSVVRKGDLAPEMDPGVLRDDLLFVVVQQQSFATLDLFRGIQVVVIDTVNDSVHAVIEDDRCVGTLSGIELDTDGTIYVVADNYLLYNWAEAPLPPTCVLRIKPGEERFDPAYHLDLDATLGHPAAALYVTGDGIAYTHDLNEDLTETDPRLAPLTFLNERVSTWFQLDLRQDTPVPLPLTSVGLTSARTGGGFTVDDRHFLPVAEDGLSGRTQLFELLDDGGASSIFSVTGRISSLGRLTPIVP